MREKVFQLAEQYVNSGRKLIRGHINTCLLGAIAASDPTKQEIEKKVVRILACSSDEMYALEAGFENWGGSSRLKFPEIWQIGADVAKKYLKGE